MELYLVQHGEAKAEEEDPDRPLTDKGRKDASRVASAAAKMDLGIGSIWHSGKLRARQTAVIFTELLEPPTEAQERPGLAPQDDPEVIANQLGEFAGPALIVGHLPHLSRLASLLLVGDPERELVAFVNGGLVCLGRDDDGWHLAWILTPEMARKLEWQTE